MKKYVSQVSLTVLGPFLTAATGVEVYGLQKAFHRDYKGKPVIPASHIKGKLKMALEELAQAGDYPTEVDILRWFGAPSAEKSYEPVPGILEFSDFTCEAEKHSSRRSRIAINHQSLTAAENQLREVEEAFKSSAGILCKGTITFFAISEKEALDLNRALWLGFKWLTSLGAEKGVGFGRMFKVQVSAPKEQIVRKIDASSFAAGDTLHLRIQPLEPIIIGGIKKRRTNYVPSEKILSGGLIKGALAACLNRAHGITPAHRELSGENAGLFPGFEALVMNFADIRVTHAFSTYLDQPRPVKLPISAVESGAGYVDTALSAERYPMLNDQALAYFIDWKSPREFWGDAAPKEIFVTRTEIDDDSRRSLEGQLFTYSFLCPEDDDGAPIEWVCNVDFSGIADSGTRQKVKHEFAQAVHAYLEQLGKLDASMRVEVRNGYAQPVMEFDDLIKDGVILITLQSDALMLNPEQVRQLSPTEDLEQLYAAFWQEISGGSSSCMELIDFYAHQTFKGGYLYHRYLGAVERGKKPDNYHPYYLTAAGSVFKLRATNEHKAREYLTKWLKSGLDLPLWAKAEYSQYERPFWQNCPFVPENGFGEIAVNLKWHWENQV